MVKFGDESMIRFIIALIIPVLFLLGILNFVFSELLPNYWWFSSFGFTHVWWRILSQEWLFFAVGFIFTFCFLYFNAGLAFLFSKRMNKSSFETVNSPFSFLNQFIQQMQQNTSQGLQKFPAQMLKLITAAGILFVSVMMGTAVKAQWLETSLFFKQVPFGVLDPIFNRDIGFYVFTLPVLESGLSLLLGLLFFTFVLLIWLYFSKNIMGLLFARGVRINIIKGHFFILFALALFILALKHWLGIYGLLNSTEGVVFGAGYTQITVLKNVYQLMSVLLGLGGVFFLVSAFRKTVWMPFLFGATLLGLNILLIGILPNIVQNYIVAPNELEKEKPYIQHNIAFTRKAYQLDKLEVTNFPALNNLTIEDINQNKNIIQNIRLWNSEPIKQTFSQLQEIRLYYEFLNIDVDRYLIDGRMEQVMLSAREMDISQLTSQAQTWQNEHFVYTHGYGAVMSPVSQVTPDGLPFFYIKDLPPVSKLDFRITKPAIYFGEKKSGYTIVNSNQEEFDYPKGESNVYAHYEGTGGVELNSYLKRLIYSIKFGDAKLLITPLIHKKSRILYDRDIMSIVNRIFPFFVFDTDPYLVIDNSGKLVWMLDAYTLTNRYPYSEPYGATGVNYFRNSVKITIDAYSGEVNAYIADTEDPLIKAYAGVFPEAFQELKEMPSDLKSHIRYPKDLFRIQTRLYSTYHMQDVQVFYNREDLWNIPNEKYGESEVLMQPYYVVTRLPGEDKESFVLMLPYTPSSKNNMIAWVVAKCDGDDYGRLKVYRFPKERTIYGPMQIESRIDQDTDISKNLTLWGQVGSRVIRGNLMVIPIKDSLVYVEPIYLQATQSKLPELKQVIFAYGDTVVMADNINSAIEKVFDHNIQYDKVLIDENMSVVSDILTSDTQKQKIQKLIETHKAMKQLSPNNDWLKWAEKMAELDRIIDSFN